MLVRADPRALIGFLGPGEEGDGYKTSREWWLKGPKGPVTIYDYASTSLYKEDMPEPEEFWRLPLVDLSVGAKSEAAANDFVLWLGKHGVVRMVYAANAETLDSWERDHDSMMA